ncbi:MAG: L,D-transpeptidase family protein [Methyloprofundus sp.]|nr:L,D-transpeptidase family protein [Methyloprofundus sp.]
MFNPIYKKYFVVLGLLLASTLAEATSFVLPNTPSDSLIKAEDMQANSQTFADEKEDLLDIALRYDLGQNEIVRLNPAVDRWLPAMNSVIQLQNTRLLPDTERKGIVLNLPEFRLYYYQTANEGQPAKLLTHPISVGRQDWDTPLGRTKIVAKKENPSWRPPASIKKEHAEKGDPLPDIVPAGPDNPLGLFAMRLGIPGYLIHSTNKPFGVGLRVSHGCIRMYPKDIEKLFPLVKVGTVVTIVNQPVKVGWFEGDLYIEVHPPLEEHQFEDLLSLSLDLIEQKNDEQLLIINSKALKQAIINKNGLPIKIYEQPK